MGRFVEAADRHQSSFLPACLEDYVDVVWELDDEDLSNRFEGVLLAEALSPCEDHLAVRNPPVPFPRKRSGGKCQQW